MKTELRKTLDVKMTMMVDHTGWGRDHGDFYREEEPSS